MKNYIYTCESYNIFPGFYESWLYNSDSEYYASEALSENGESYEIRDFPEYQKEVCEKTASVLWNALPVDCIIKNIDFYKMESPQYYNFSTDKILFKIDFDKRGLLTWIKQHKTEFNQHLKENFTSRDGFWSFIENNYNDFMDQYIEEGRRGRCLDLMIDFYLNSILDVESYQCELMEAADEILYNNMEVVNNEK